MCGSVAGNREKALSPLRWSLMSKYVILIINKRMIKNWPPLWSGGQSSWLQIRRPGFDSRHYQISEEKKKKTVGGLERGPLGLVSTTEELLDRKVAAPV
jgi:hypothetical protein